ncbi:MAG: ABC transporter ATP-binding protein [Patescibacteria group bacterium]
MPTSKVLIKATGLNQDFVVGKETISVLKNVNFEIADNTFNIVYGQSGSGKSTLLNILTGLQRPSTGNISFNDEDIYSYDSDKLARFRASRIGIVYQQNYWVQSLNVVENVAMPLFFLGYEQSLAKEMALISLERVDMVKYAKQNPALLSGGEQQRISMARALVNDPLFIIADEPTGSLDSKNGDMIMDLLSKSYTESLRTVILVTHNMEYLPLADHLLHIQDGEVQELKHNTIQATTNALMKEMKDRIDKLAATKKRSGS